MINNLFQNPTEYHDFDLKNTIQQIIRVDLRILIYVDSKIRTPFFRLNVDYMEDKIKETESVLYSKRP